MQNNSGEKSMNTVTDLDQVANKVKNNYIIIIYIINLKAKKI